MKVGAAYYPEHWPVTRWADDARLMRDAGFNVVRLGEFAWHRMEPEPDCFNFAWLDQAIDTLNAAGIAVLLGTPTAGPPTWLVNPRPGRPDCRQLYEDGTRWEAGGRSLCCVNQPYFIERSCRIAAALGVRYAAHAGIVGFQIDNEVGMYGTRCYCDVCVAGFRSWLRAKYGSIQALNERLGMVFGGNEFSCFDDVPLPRRGQDLHNPGLLVDSQRFFSDSNVGYVRAQQEALRAAGVRQPITTNVCHMFGGGDAIDGRALFETLDVVGWDCYPTQFAADPPPATLGLLHAVARGYREAPYWMLEQQSGSPMGARADDPRRARLWTWQAIAHGAELILYFRWRTARFGGEQYWRGILDHDGAPNERYRAIARTGAEIARTAPLLDATRPANDVAVLLDFDACVSLDFNPPGSGLPYRAQAEVFVAALQKLGRGVDVVYDTNDLDRYQVVIAPLLRLIDDALAAGLTQYVRRGGTLVATMLTATLDRDHVAPAAHPPYLLTDLFGIERLEWGSLNGVAAPPKELMGKDIQGWDAVQGAVGSIPVHAEAGYGLRAVYGARSWYDHIRVSAADVLARFGDGTPASGAPAVTTRSRGDGRALYIASVMEQGFYDDLMSMLLGGPTGPVRVDAAGGQVEIIPARRGNDRVYFVLNHDAVPRRVCVSEPLNEVLSGMRVDSDFELAAYDVAILTGVEHVQT